MQARAQFKRRSTANNVEILVPVPEDADSPRFRTNIGSVHYAPEKSAIIWKIKQFGGGKEFLMRAELGLPSVKGDDELGGGMTGGFGGSMGGVAGLGGGGKGKRPISVKFEIPYFTTSGIQVRYLKIIEPKVSFLFFLSSFIRMFSISRLLCISRPHLPSFPRYRFLISPSFGERVRGLGFPLPHKSPRFYSCAFPLSAPFVYPTPSIGQIGEHGHELAVSKQVAPATWGELESCLQIVSPSCRFRVYASGSIWGGKQSICALVAANLPADLVIAVLFPSISEEVSLKCFLC